jgi:16S rRNA (adenine1518-N6/adenine1519-N6)-dimethyltransferase
MLPNNFPNFGAKPNEMSYVRPKKALGQHFLKDQNIARKIVSGLKAEGITKVIEVGPGMGVLTRFLLERNEFETIPVEVDSESVAFLNAEFPVLKDKIVAGDFLELKLEQISTEKMAVIGNFPYNISSQIFFKVLENRSLVDEVVCMVQKEVAQRIASPPGSKEYGILSVFLQAFYKIEYLFTVHENVFAPPPKVKSGVIRLSRNGTHQLDCNEDLFFKVVKATFNQRRKVISNSIKALRSFSDISHPLFSKRPEQLPVGDFVLLTNLVEKGE